MRHIKVRRTVVAEILDRVRQDLADRVAPEEIERRLAGSAGSGAYNQAGFPALEPLKVCAHNAHTDNCGACAPRWGHTGAKVVCS